MAFDRDFGGYNPKHLTPDGTDSLLFAELDVYRNAGPAVSPDGRWVAMSLQDEDRTLQVARVDGTDVVPLDTQTESPSWSPDGTQLTYVREVKGGWELRVVDVAGKGEPVPLDSFPARVQPQWSPLGDEIAFVLSTQSLRAISLDGAKQRIIVPSHPDFWLGETCAWSPDGSALAYTRNADAKRSDPGVFVVSADGKQEHPVYDSDRYDEHPAWSPDGQQIVFVHRSALGTYDLLVADASGKSKPALWFAEDFYTIVGGQGWRASIVP